MLALTNKQIFSQILDYMAYYKALLAGLLTVTRRISVEFME